MKLCAFASSLLRLAKEICFATALICFGAHAADLYTYDLDSLVYLGPKIVEGALGPLHATNNFWEFKVSAIDNGAFKIGQTIGVCDLGLFCVAKNDFGLRNGSQLKEGDHLLLFGARTGTTPFYHIPATNKIYWIAPSGVRLIVGKKALKFRQYANPGPYLAVLEGAATDPAVPTLIDLRRQIRESVARVAAWRPLLDQKPATNNIPALLRILRQRPHSSDGFYMDVDKDFIAGQVCQTLDALHDSETLLQAAQISGYTWDLASGFRNPAGREFLRQHIADESASIQTRILCANLLNAASGGVSTERQFKWLAERAAQPGQNEKLQMTLVETIRAIARWGQPASEATNATILQDRKDAGAILTQLATNTSSEELKYNIDLALPELGLAPLSSNNCLLQLDRYDRSSGTLHLICRISNVSGLLHPSVAFVNLKTSQKWAAPSNLYFHGNEAESPGDVTVPRDLPHGRYKVFYEFSENGTVKSTSHYFETDL